MKLINWNMMIKKPKRLLFFGVTFVSIVLGVAFTVYSYFCRSEEARLDTQKKKIVYKMYADYKKDFPDIPDITANDAMELIKAGKAVFVDTRKQKEMEVSTLPNAVTKEAFLKDPQKYGKKTVIGYCTISYRSGILAQKLSKDGIRMFNLKGGILAWVLEGGKIYDQNGETRRIHVYGKKWNYPANGYEAIW
jgi:sodium/bile acid cotransporter 7